MVPLAYLAVGLSAYLLGSIPTGFLVAKARGIDIRTVGSGNIGATNVFRTLGKPAGIFVLLVDGLKGWLAVVVLGQWLGSLLTPADSQTIEWLAVTAGVGAILGHNYTCWLYFKGGKGIATSAGALLALVTWAFLIILVIWVIVFALSRYVSLASICAAFALPFATYLTRESRTMVLVTAGLAALAIYKHRSNIQRLIKGTESRIGSKKPTTPQTEASTSPR